MDDERICDVFYGRLSPDEAWGIELAAGHPDAIQSLIDFSRTITKYYLGRYAMPDWEQAAMDVTEIVLEKIKSEKIKNLRGWIRRVARNQCISLLRKEFGFSTRSRDDSGVLIEPLDAELSNYLVADDLILGGDEIDMKLELKPSYFDILSQREQKIIQLFLEGHKPVEISKMMGITANNVRASWNQLLKKLRNHYSEEMRSL